MQNQDLFDNQGRNAMQCITFLLGKFRLELKIQASKKVETMGRNLAEVMFNILIIDSRLKKVQ